LSKAELYAYAYSVECYHCASSFKLLSLIWSTTTALYKCDLRQLCYQVCLELVEVDVQGSVEPERSRDGRNDLRDQPVQVGVRRHRQVQVLHAQVVDCLRTSWRWLTSIAKGILIFPKCIYIYDIFATAKVVYIISLSVHTVCESLY